MLRSVLTKFAGLTVALLLVVSSFAVFAPTKDVSAAQPRDCDANAVMFCGAYSTSELIQKYRGNQGGDLKAIYSHFGLKSESYLKGMVNGRVTKSGEIWVGNKKVATGAVTSGRHKMGSDEVKVPGANAWMRPPSRSFRSNSLDAFVKLNSRGEFVYGVIKSCGNPLQAQNKFKFPPKPQPPKPQPPKPQPPKPQPKKPDLSISKDVRNHGDTEWEQEVVADQDGTLQYRITVKNTGETDLKNLRIKDTLPQDVSFEDANLEGSSAVTGFKISELVGEGIVVNSLAKGGIIEIRFAVTISSDAEACETPMRNLASAKADDVPEEEDDALAKVCQPDQPEVPEKPAPPQVEGKQTPPELPATGAAGALGIFSASSFLGFAAYKLKEFYSVFLR